MQSIINYDPRAKPNKSRKEAHSRVIRLYDPGHGKPWQIYLGRNHTELVLLSRL